MTSPFHDFSCAIRIGIREIRSCWRDLLFLVIPIIAGCASVVALGSFKENVVSSFDEHTKTLLGADLALFSHAPLPQDIQSTLSGVESERARELSFAAMLRFRKTGESRLVQVNAVSETFPLYGEVLSEPSGGSSLIKDGNKILVDQNLLYQFDANVGDIVSVGELELRIAGALLSVPGASELRSVVAPRVYLPYHLAEKTGLLKRGSHIHHNLYLKIPKKNTIPSLRKTLQSSPNSKALRIETLSSKKERLKELLSRVYTYLDLIAFVSLILGAIGSAGATELFIQHKLKSASVLRCLGASTAQTFVVYFVQLALFASLASLFGAVLGVIVQQALPEIFSSLIPSSVKAEISLSAISSGIGLSLSVVLLFALTPLIRLRNISPLLALRLDFVSAVSNKREEYLCSILALSFAVLMLMLHGDSSRIALLFSISFLAILGGLVLCTALFQRLAALFLGKRWPYCLRQGFLNLSRPRNQTRILLVVIGFTTALFVSVSDIERMLVEHLGKSEGKNQANLILFDIQRDQIEELEKFISPFSLKHHNSSPVVSMRLYSIKGKTISELKEAKTRIPDWTLNREYRSTYRDALVDTEELIEGDFIKNASSDLEPIPISLEKRIAKRLGVGIGDEIVVDVQGVLLTTQITSIRRVQWQRVRPNFFIVFPTGVLEEAPQFLIWTLQTKSQREAATFQRALASAFPTISVIDTRLVLATLDQVLTRLKSAVGFLRFAVILTAILVFTVLLYSARHERRAEVVLFKALGAAKGTLWGIAAAECVFIALIGSLSGIVLSWLASYLLANRVLNLDFSIDFHFAGLAALAVLLIAAALTFFSTRQAYAVLPIEVLREERG